MPCSLARMCLAQVTLLPKALTRLTGTSCLEMRIGSVGKMSLQLIGGMLAFGISVRTSLQGSHLPTINCDFITSAHPTFFLSYPGRPYPREHQRLDLATSFAAWLLTQAVRSEHQKSYLDLSCKQFLTVGSGKSSFSLSSCQDCWFSKSQETQIVIFGLVKNRSCRFALYFCEISHTISEFF